MKNRVTFTLARRGSAREWRGEPKSSVTSVQLQHWGRENAEGAEEAHYD